MSALFVRSLSAPVRLAAVLTPLIASAAPAPAAPEGGVQELVLSAVSQSIGDIGAAMAFYTNNAAEMSEPQAIQQCEGMLATTGQMTSELASALSFLCTHYGMQTCEAAGAASSLSQHLTLAGQHLQQANFQMASVEVRGARASLSKLMTLEGSSVIPDDVQGAFINSMSALDSAADVLLVLSSPEAFSACFDYVFEQHDPTDSSAMLTALQSPAVFGWPAGLFPFEVIDVDYTPGMWDDGGALAAGLLLPAAQSILTNWKELGPNGVLDTLGFAALASTFNQAGSELQSSMYMLGDLLDSGVVLGGGCPEECTTDDDCGGCRVEKCGVGLEWLDPDEISSAKLIVDVLMKIDVQRNGVPSVTSREEIRKSVTGAFGSLTDKLLANSGHLYVYVVANYCDESWCWIFWWEHQCEVKNEEWLKVPLPLIQSVTPISSWTNVQWQTATSALHAKAAEWCATNG